MAKEVVLTGLRSNAEFHLGNYLGAILPMAEMQKVHAGQYQLNMFIPDLHSFTTPIDHGTLYEQTLENLKVFYTALMASKPSAFKGQFIASVSINSSMGPGIKIKF